MSRVQARYWLPILNAHIGVPTDSSSSVGWLSVWGGKAQLIATRADFKLDLDRPHPTVRKW
jgi:hypothetical protein